MDFDRLSLMKPVYQNVEQFCKEQIIEHLDGLGELQKVDLGIIVNTPVIPENPEEIQRLIDEFVELYEPQTPKEEEELKWKLIDQCEYAELIIDSNLPLKEFQKEMRLQLQQMSNEKKLEIDLFGPVITQEMAKRNKSIIVALYMMYIIKAAHYKALIQIGRASEASLEPNSLSIANQFPFLVRVVKNCLLDKKEILN